MRFGCSIINTNAIQNIKRHRKQCEKITMEKSKLLFLNRLSGVNFFISTLCLLLVAFMDMSNGFSEIVYIIVTLFWICLIIGIVVQIFLSVHIRKRKLSVKFKYQIVFYVIALATLILLIVLIFMDIHSVFLVDCCLVISVGTLETVTIIKKERCLK